MKLGETLLKIGSAVVKDVIPGGGLLVDLVNSFLPEDKKVPVTATGDEVTKAVTSLPEETRLALLSKEIDVELAEISAWPKVQASLAQADAAGASTRPRIAMMMAVAVIYADIVGISAWAWALYQHTATLANSWPIVVAILATPTALLRAYFGMRSKDKQARYSAAVGQPVKPNLLADILKAMKG